MAMTTVQASKRGAWSFQPYVKIVLENEAGIVDTQFTLFV